MSRILSSRRASLLTSLALQNQNLRVVLWSTIAGSILTIAPLICLSMRTPLIVGLAPSGPVVLNVAEEVSTLSATEAKAFLFDLAAKKYPKNAESDSGILVCHYFTDELRGPCEKELSAKRNFISQDVVFQDLNWDEARGLAVANIKRFANFGGTIASIETNLKIGLSKRTRTKENPWGIFVTSWKEEVVK